MQIEYDGNKSRRREVKDLWLRIATDFNAKIPVDIIRERYLNPKTGKPYNRTHIYYILKQVKEMEIN